MTSCTVPRMGVRQLRVAVMTEDFDAAVAFFRDVLGLPVELAVSSDGGAEVVILDAGRATLEIGNLAQKRPIDDVEVGRPVAPSSRLAPEIDDAAAATDAAERGGAERAEERRAGRGWKRW